MYSRWLIERASSLPYYLRLLKHWRKEKGGRSIQARVASLCQVQPLRRYNRGCFWIPLVSVNLERKEGGRGRKGRGLVNAPSFLGSVLFRSRGKGWCEATVREDARRSEATDGWIDRQRWRDPVLVPIILTFKRFNSDGSEIL